MKAMRMITIGSFFDHDFADNIHFRSPISFLDYDIVLIDFEYVLTEYDTNQWKVYRGYRNLNESNSEALIKDIERRKFEILETLKFGRTVIVFTPGDQICYVDTGEREYSGTGRNRLTTYITSEVNILSVLPVEFETVEACGTSINFRGDGQFSVFWDRNKDSFCYRAYFKKPVGTPLWFIKGTDKVVGSFMPFEKGNLIFMPTYSYNDEDEKHEKDFLKSIVYLVKELNKSTGDFRLPSWCLNYLLPKEEARRLALKKYESDLNKITHEISKQKKVIAGFEEYKILFSGTGRALEVQVGKVFSELGFVVAEGLPGRDDFILNYKDKVAVVEVKGVSKSASEKHAAQLEKWVSEYISCNGTSPKGILIVNAFKDVPLNLRTEDPFPAQMITYSTNRNHCLLSGIQLLCLFLFCKENPEKREEMVEQLLTTNGVFGLCTDWTRFLSIRDETIEKVTKKCGTSDGFVLKPSIIDKT
ncbi:MAG TPA: hypothetical protein DC024_11730 [Clostridiales bacterium]|jgi:hypothetical protein|nr:hypothetical protein [Clostridiales bacterium]